MSLRALCKGHPLHGRYYQPSLLAKAMRQLKIIDSELKLIRIMRLTAILLFACSMHVAASGFGQITLKARNVPLQQVLADMQQQSGFDFVYTAEMIAAGGNVTVNLANVSVETALTEVLRGKSLSYSIDGKIVAIVPAVDLSPRVASPRPLLETPPITVRGRIVNENGEPVVASVTIKGTNKGTTSNANGEFELNNVDDHAVLVITATNIEAIAVNVNNQRNLSIGVKTALSSLNEVVVNKGYYSEKKRFSTGNVSTVNSKAIEKQPVSNPLQAIQGRVPGLEITQQTGVPGGSFRIRLRGQNSIAKGNDPLFIIDGVPFTNSSQSQTYVSGDILRGGSSPLNYLNPMDIENIEVLKDADATAIYGSRGANGVILITTKKGRLGKTKVDINIYGGKAKIARKLDILNTSEYLAMRKEAYANAGITTYPNDAHDINGTWVENRQTDWQKELIGASADYTDAQLSVSGGSANIQYLIGGGFHKETTVFPGNNSDKRSSIHFSLNSISENKRFKVNFSSNYSVLNTNLLSYDITSKAISLAPNAPALYSGDGSLNWDTLSTGTPTWENPVSYLKQPYEGNTNNLVSNMLCSYGLLPGLEIKTSASYSNVSSQALTLIPVSSKPPNLPSLINGANFGSSRFNNWQIEPQISWNRNIKKGYFNALVGTTFLNQEEEGLSQTAEGFSSEALMQNIGAASKITPTSNSYSLYRYTAIYGRLNYTYDQKYIINITGRRDGSSRFGPGRQFANFGAAGIAWIFTEEKFMSNSDWLSFGKLRISYGTSGNDQIGNYEYLDTYRPDGAFQSITVLAPVRLNNPIFAWEENKKAEAGLELSFLKEKIYFIASYYLNRSSNQLVGFPLAPTAGFPAINANLPAKVQNNGIELELNTRIIEKKNFSWSTSLNITVPNNKLLEYPGLENSVYAGQYVIGEPLSIRKLFQYTGIDENSGLYTVKDVNNDGNYTQDDRINTKFVGTKFYGGFQNSIQYKGFQLDLFFQFVNQTNQGYQYFFGMPGSMANQLKEVLNGNWKEPGDVSSVQRLNNSFDAQQAYDRFIQSDAVITNGSFIRLKNLSLGYNFRSPILKRLHFANLRLFIQGQNLLTFTKYKGLDPEYPPLFSLPPLKVLTGGIHITF